MSKRIIEGCRAVIVNSEAGNNGIEVTVGKFIGCQLTMAGDTRWAIDKRVNTVSGITGRPSGTAQSMEEYQLRRIDDDSEELSSWETVEALCNWNPEKQTVNE